MAGQTISSSGSGTAGARDAVASDRPAPAGGLFRQAPAWAVSMLVHVIVLLAMALIVSEPPQADLRPKMIVSNAPESMDDIGDLPQDAPDQLLPTEEVVDPTVVPDTAVENVQVVTDAEDLTAPAVAVELSEFGSELVQPSDLLAGIGGISGQAGGLGGRSDPQMRQQLVLAGGGNAQTEAAVEAALKWFIAHQMPDGGWSFDFASCPSCQGQCTHPGDKGRAADRCGATALALLPFLGRGYTHREGPYKKQLDAGIAFLAGMSLQGEGKCYAQSGNMYSQGLAGIVLSESYAMSKDPRLQLPAQLALNFIMTAQDPVGGGWRYSPKQPGDTSAVGWQLMALKSGDMANLRVNPLTVKKAISFLDSVQSDDGAAYGYTDKSTPAPARNAVGLLCRMYLGWKKNNPALQRGVANLAKAGPSKDLYHDYYATQVLHHMEGDAWTAWNTRMRDMLLNTQAKRGHEAGSWYDGVEGGHGADAAGRLYCTALSAMILEVYYRHLPIYGQQSIEEEFRE